MDNANETLEEAAKKHAQRVDLFPELENPVFSFKEGARWQADRMFSQREMMYFAGYCKALMEVNPFLSPQDAFEQFLKLDLSPLNLKENG